MARILSYFPEGMTPRPAQKSLLYAIQREWDKTDVFVITAPTSFGKTALASTIMRYEGFAAYIAPNNLLVDQASEAVPLAPVLRSRDSYHCATHRCTCQETHDDTGGTCGDRCPYERALKQASSRQMSITNYHTYLAHRLYKSTLIVDEAHLMVSMLQDLATRRIWRREYNWPTTCRTTGDLVDWLDALKASGRTLDAKLTRLYRELTSIKPSSLVIRTTESWRNSPPQDVLKIIPLDTRAEPPVMWPGHRVRKIVLMSATISPKDIETMGLDNRRVTYLEAKSPIPVSQRPIKFDPVGSMSYRARSATMPALVARIRSMMNSRPTKGLIHATYDVADALREEMATDPRMIFHGRDDKMTVYDKWRRSDPDDGKVLVACGMYEGIDVVGDAGRWQVITKVPFPSLTDPAIRAKLQDDRDWYLWNTLRLVVQAAGRICRTPDDYGETVIVDSDWERLAADADASGLMPTFFKEALTD